MSFQMYHITKCTQGRHFCPSKCTIYMREAFLSFQMYLMSLIKPQLSKPLPSLAVQRNQRERERERVTREQLPEDPIPFILLESIFWRIFDNSSIISRSSCYLREDSHIMAEVGRQFSLLRRDMFELLKGYFTFKNSFCHFII